MKKKNIIWIFSTFIALISISLLYFLLPLEKKDFTSHIVSYVCFMLSFLFLVSFLFFHSNKEKKAENLTLSLPLLKTIGIFAGIVCALLVIEYVINIFVPVPFYVPLVLFLLLISIAIFLLGMKKTNIRHIEQNEMEEEKATSLMKDLRIQSKFLLSLSKDETTKNNMNKIVEILQYSDPVSNEKTIEIEKTILDELKNFQIQIENGQQVSDISAVLTKIEERNLLCQHGKR